MCFFFAKSRGLSGEGAPDYINLLSIGIWSYDMGLEMEYWRDL